MWANLLMSCGKRTWCCWMKRKGKLKNMAGWTTYFKLPGVERAALWEAWFRLLHARLMLGLLPFKRIAGILGQHMKETPKEIPVEYNHHIRLVRQALKRLSRRTPWESACLVQAIAGKKMLQKRGISSTLYLGVTKDEQKVKKMKAHAWLRCGGIIVTGKEGFKQFTVVSFFGENVI